jgi:hypothetical protein
VGTRISAVGAPVELIALPGDKVWQMSYSRRGTSRSGKWDDAVWTDSSRIEWNKDVYQRGLAFSFVNAAEVEPTHARSRPAYLLGIDPDNGILARWRSRPSDGKAGASWCYHLTRKLPGSVERTANREGPERPLDQAKKSWLDEKSNWDLRGIH